MLPAAAVSGFYLAHPAASYFAVGRIGRDQIEDYARRNPWQAMGIAAGVGLVVGVLLARR